MSLSWATDTESLTEAFSEGGVVVASCGAVIDRWFFRILCSLQSKIAGQARKFLCGIVLVGGLLYGFSLRLKAWSGSELNYVETPRRAVGLVSNTLEHQFVFSFRNDQNREILLDGRVTQLGLWVKWGGLPAIQFTLSVSSGTESQRFRLYLPVLILRAVLVEVDLATMKGFYAYQGGRTVVLRGFEAGQITLRTTGFLNPGKYSWRSAWSLGEWQKRSGGSFLIGAQMGIYSLRNVSDTMLLDFREFGAVYLSPFTGYFFNWVPRALNRSEDIRIAMGLGLRVGPSLLLESIRDRTRQRHNLDVLLFGMGSLSLHVTVMVRRVLFRVMAGVHRLRFTPRRWQMDLSSTWGTPGIQVLYLFPKKRKKVVE